MNLEAIRDVLNVGSISLSQVFRKSWFKSSDLSQDLEKVNCGDLTTRCQAINRGKVKAVDVLISCYPYGTRAIVIWQQCYAIDSPLYLFSLSFARISH
jgi:hypothetical protein